MKELKLEHLAPYSICKLKLQQDLSNWHSSHGFKKGETRIVEFKGFSIFENENLEVINIMYKINTRASGNSTIDEFKPILRPLSQLTEEIEHNGEKFVPIEYLHEKCETEPDYEWIIHFDDGNNLNADWSLSPYWMVKKLFEWHFDFFNLINQNLAIDITKLRK